MALCSDAVAIVLFDTAVTKAGTEEELSTFDTVSSNFFNIELLVSFDLIVCYPGVIGEFFLSAVGSVLLGIFVALVCLPAQATYAQKMKIRYYFLGLLFCREAIGKSDCPS